MVDAVAAAQLTSPQQDHGISLQADEKTPPSFIHSNDSSDTDPEIATNCFASLLQECLFVLTVTYAVSANQIAGGVFLCITNYIGNGLHMNSAELTWINTAQSLTSGASLLLFGRAGDFYGRKKLLLISLVASTACLVAIGFVKDAILMDALLGLLGLVSAAAVPSAMGKLGAVYSQPSKRRNRAFAFCSAGTPVGSGLGVVIGGLALHWSTWRASVWVLAIINACFSIVALLTVPRDDKGRPGKEPKALKEFDILGALLAAIGIALVTIPMTLAGETRQGWHSPSVYGVFISGFAVLFGFTCWLRIRSNPLIPPAIWKDHTFTLLVLTLSLCFFGFVGNTIWLCLSWQRVEHAKPLEVAAKLLPAITGAACVDLFLALTMHRISHRLFVLLGVLASVASNALLSANSGHFSWWALTFPALILMAAGADLLFTTTINYGMSLTVSEHQSIAGGVLFTLTRFATTLGLGAQTNIYTAYGGTSSGPGALNHRAYQSTAWVSLGGSVAALLFLPFIKIHSPIHQQKGKTPPRDRRVEV